MWRVYPDRDPAPGAGYQVGFVSHGIGEVSTGAVVTELALFYGLSHLNAT